jgi:hypothetical protein
MKYFAPGITPALYNKLARNMLFALDFPKKIYKTPICRSAPVRRGTVFQCTGTAAPSIDPIDLNRQFKLPDFLRKKGAKIALTPDVLFESP